MAQTSKDLEKLLTWICDLDLGVGLLKNGCDTLSNDDAYSMCMKLNVKRS